MTTALAAGISLPPLPANTLPLLRSIRCRLAVYTDTGMRILLVIVAALFLFSSWPPAAALAEEAAPAPSASPQAASPQAASPQAKPEASASDIDGQQMFATTCGYCHQDGGRAAGRGPKLSKSERSDEFIIDRVKKGKPGAMPAFGSVFTDGQIVAILAYIRGLDD
jgi:mono/diheme cytochrome c family protein